jgi:hypothetical protein
MGFKQGHYKTWTVDYGLDHGLGSRPLSEVFKADIA